MKEMDAPSELDRTEEENQHFRERLIIAFIALLLISGFIIAVRLYTKLRIVRNLGPEDVCILCAYVSAIAMTICFCLEAGEVPAKKNGFGSEEQQIKAFKILFGSVMTSYATLFFTKMSFCFQYLRIFPGKRMRIAIYITIAASVIYILQSVLTMVLMCQPLSSFWEDGGFIVPGKCLDFKTTLYISAAINLVTDIMIILLPIPGLKSLQLPAREKIGLIAVFSLGLGVCIISVLRIIALVLAPLMYYPSWAGQPISLWTSIEANLAMICSCLPLLRPILVRFFRKMDLYGKGDRGLAYFSSKLKSGGSTLLNKTNVGGDESGSSDSKIQSEKAEGSTTSANSQNIMIHTTYEISHAKGEKPESESRANMFDNYFNA